MKGCESMFPIRQARWLAPGVRWLVVEAPRVAARHKAGHFVIVRVVPDGERIPLTVADSDASAGTITLVIQKVGATTELLCDLGATTLHQRHEWHEGHVHGTDPCEFLEDRTRRRDGLEAAVHPRRGQHKGHRSSPP